MHKGELCGLRKVDVDLVERTITVRHSYGRDTTKGGHADVIPVAPTLLPHLAVAMEASPSDLVFPVSDGSTMLCARGKLHCIRVLNAIRVSPADLEALLQAQCDDTMRR